MNIGILGTGLVGETIGTALVKKGYHVMLGSRNAVSDVAASWVAMHPKNASQGKFGDAAAHGDVIFLCLNGAKALEALAMADPSAFAGKLVIDVTNPLDFSKGMPPVLVDSMSNTTSLGEQIQTFLPGARVVKALNTITAKLMVEPSLVNGGDHTLPICGNDAAAKAEAVDLLSRAFGWRPTNILDLGDISAARITEAYVPLWVRFWQATGSPMFNIKIVQ